MGRYVQSRVLVWVVLLFGSSLVCILHQSRDSDEVVLHHEKSTTDPHDTRAYYGYQAFIRLLVKLLSFVIPPSGKKTAQHGNRLPLLVAPVAGPAIYKSD